MGLLDVFKKKGSEEKQTPPGNPEPASTKVGAYEIIMDIMGEDTYRKDVTSVNKFIHELITEKNVCRKTELLRSGLDTCLEFLEALRKTDPAEIGNVSIALFIYLKTFLDCTLALDTYIIDIKELYSLFRVSKTIKPGTHPYAKLMITIYDALDSGIVYLYQNIDLDTGDYFSPVEKSIRRMLNAYTDDDTGWNKINPQ